jgi:hypothetical protein
MRPTITTSAVVSAASSRTAAFKTVLFKTAFVASVLAVAAIAAQRANADEALCSANTRCAQDRASVPNDERYFRFSTALGPMAHRESSLRRPEMSDQDFSSFSGVGVVSCNVDGKQRSSTAFLVGAFDIGVTVAHTFEKDSNGAAPSDCMYNSMDSLGQVRERIPVSYVKSQWDEAGAVHLPTTDFAVIRLSEPSRYAQRTMPLGRFSGDTAPVVMVGFEQGIDADTMKRKARGTVHEGRAGVAGFVHDMDSRGLAPGAPVIDERTGVIIGMHTQLATSSNGMITMNDWLEATLRREIKSRSDARPN